MTTHVQYTYSKETWSLILVIIDSGKGLVAVRQKIDTRSNADLLAGPSRRNSQQNLNRLPKSFQPVRGLYAF